MSLTDNLVSHWKFDEASGNAADSASTNTLTNNGTATFASAKINNGADLELSSSQYFSITDVAQLGLDIVSDISMSCWFKPESQPATDDGMALVGKFLNTGNQRSYSFQYVDRSSVKKLAITISADGVTSETIVSVAQTLTNATMYHLAFTWKASTSTATFYVNGVSIGTAVGTFTSIFDSTAQFTIGALQSPTTFTDGIIDEVSIWSKEITATEVSQLYNAGGGVTYPFSNNYSLTIALGSFAFTGYGANFIKSNLVNVSKPITSITNISKP